MLSPHRHWQGVGLAAAMPKHIILFMAANPSGTSRRALDREAHAIRSELERSGYRDCFAFETRWAVEPHDLLRELRKLKPTVVHFSGRGAHDDESPRGLFFQGSDDRAQVVSAAAITETFGAAGASVKLVVLNACYTASQAEALLAHVDCVVGISGSIHDDAARSFAIGFYGGLGEREPVEAAFHQGRAAISLVGLPDRDRPQLKVRLGIDADQLVLTALPRRESRSAGGETGRRRTGGDPVGGDRPSLPPQTTGTPPREPITVLVTNVRPLAAFIVLTTLTIVAIRLAASPRAPRTVDSHPTPPMPPEGMALIPAAELQMGSSEQELEGTFDWCKTLSTECRRDLYERERPARRVRVSAFFLDRHERTNAELASWLSASPRLHVDPEGWARIGTVRVADLSSTSSPLRQHHETVIVDPARPERGALPATYVTHDGARLFCRARGFDLPTEAQWERAARGPEARRFPWGDEPPTCDRAVFARAEPGACAAAGDGPVPASTDTRDRTPEGVLHLGGNVAEWVLDRFAPYPACEQPCADPIAPPTASAQEMRVIRGGSADGLAEQLRSAGRSRFLARDANKSTGFRCAAPLPEDI